MLAPQSNKFHIPEDVVYLNCAYWSPQLKSVEEAGINALRRKNKPYEVKGDDFFHDRKILCSLFSELIDAGDPQRVAIIPSVSYGMANVINNVNIKPGQNVVLIDEQFPSNFYGWKRLATDSEIELKVIKPPAGFSERGKTWNRNLIEAIDNDTAVVAMPHVHWADGTLFNLLDVRKKCDEVGALLILDGTQSIGAYPFSVAKIRPDALICGGYKWLLGPYSLGVAYYGEYFDNGTPIEDNWINRLNSHDFANLTSYQDKFEPKAARYSVGESSNFILVPMLIKSLEQLLEWGVDNIKDYCESIAEEPIEKIREKGYWIEDKEGRASHLFGIYLTPDKNMDEIKQRLLNANIHVSYRGKAIRISPNVYNIASHLDHLVNTL